MQEQERNDRKQCPNCNARIHPLDLSDILLGRKRECPRCFSMLQAQTSTAIGVIAAVVVTIFAAVAPTDLLPMISWWQAMLTGMFIAVLVWAAPPGLIAGAPWVRIVARDPESGVLGIQQRVQRMAAVNAKREPGGGA